MRSLFALVLGIAPNMRVMPQLRKDFFYQLVVEIFYGLDPADRRGVAVSSYGKIRIPRLYAGERDPIGGARMAHGPRHGGRGSGSGARLVGDLAERAGRHRRRSG